jgi:hypothetical protein
MQPLAFRCSPSRPLSSAVASTHRERHRRRRRKELLLLLCCFSLVSASTTAPLRTTTACSVGREYKRRRNLHTLVSSVVVVLLSRPFLSPCTRFLGSTASTLRSRCVVLRQQMDAPSSAAESVRQLCQTRRFLDGGGDDVNDEVTAKALEYIDTDSGLCTATPKRPVSTGRRRLPFSSFLFLVVLLPSPLRTLLLGLYDPSHEGPCPVNLPTAYGRFEDNESQCIVVVVSSRRRVLLDAL